MSVTHTSARRTVVLRADGNSQIGLGHFTRTLALADMLKYDFECVFALVNPSSYQLKELKNAAITLHTLSEENHLNAFLDLLHGGEIVVLDNYFFDTVYHKRIKGKGCQLVCIDDLINQHFVADVIINHSGGIDEYAYSCEPYTKVYTGTEYALLRKEFLKPAAERYNKIKTVAILICLGGADPSNETLKILKLLEQKKEETPIYTVVGAANGNLEELTSFASQTKLNVSILRGLSAGEMLRYMQLCSTAITAPSSIAFEYIAVGGILYLCLTANNQKSIYNYFVDKVAFDFSCYPITDGQVIRSILYNQGKMIDGKSPQRLREVFSALN